MNKPGFVVLTVKASDLIMRGYSFDVVLADDEVKAYATDKESWRKIESDISNHMPDWNMRGAKPLLVSSESFLDTAEQMGWVIVGGKN